MSPRPCTHVVAPNGSGGKFSVPGCEALGCSPERAAKMSKRSSTGSRRVVELPADAACFFMRDPNIPNSQEKTIIKTRGRRLYSMFLNYP